MAYLSIPIAASSVTLHCLMADAAQTRYNSLADRHKEAPYWYAFHCFSPFECNLLLICGEICSSPVRRTIHVPSYSLAMAIQPAYIGRGYEMKASCCPSTGVCSLSRKRLHVFLGYLLDMHVHIHLLLHSFAVLPLVLCGSGQYSSTPVSYQQAPSYYPGAPWAFPDASTRPKTCHVAAANGTGDDAPNIIKAFERCGRNGKVIFDNTTCTVA